MTLSLQALHILHSMRNTDSESKEADCCSGLHTQILFLHQEQTCFPLLLDRQTQKELKPWRMYLKHIVAYKM